MTRKTSQRMRRAGAAVAALALTGLATPAAFADPTPSPSASGSSAPPSLGGWQLSASAAPFTMEIYDPKIPIPAQPGQPNLEFDFSYTRAKFASGPSGSAIASWLWPGDAIAFGLGTLINQPNFKYPIMTNVQFPSQTPDATQQPLPGSYMQSHTDADGATAVSTFGLPLPGTGPSAAPSGATSAPAPAATTTSAPGFLGGLIPAPQLPDVGTMLRFMFGGGPFVDVEGERSQCSTTVKGASAVASAESDAGTLSLLGGLIQFHGLQVTATSTSDGTKGTSKGDVDYGSMTIAGIDFGISADGIVTPFGKIALPQLPDAINTILAPIGITFALPTASDLSQDAQGQMFSHGMQITIDTAVLKKLLPLTPILKTLIAQVPPQLTSQLPAQLNQIIQILPDLAPKIVMTIGSAKSQAIASPPIDLSGGGTTGSTTPPSTAPSSSAAAGTTGGSSSGGGSSSSGGSIGGDTSGGTTGAAAPVAAPSSAPDNGGLAPTSIPQSLAGDKTSPAAFGGLPGQLTGGALVLTCVVAWAIRKYSSLLFGGAGCELGHETAVPDLRAPTD
jgi:hypothetical protein